LAEDKSEIYSIITRLSDAEFGEFGVFDKLESDVLDEILKLGGDCFHDVKVVRSVAGVGGIEKEYLWEGKSIYRN
jgi:hypothetical protein